MSDVSLYKQTAERAVMTFLQAFLAVFSVADLSTGKTAVTAGVAAALSVVKSFVATKVGDKTTASLV